MRKDTNNEIENPAEKLQEQIEKLAEINLRMKKIEENRANNSEIGFLEYGQNCALFCFFAFVGWAFGMIEDKEIGGYIGVAIYLTSFAFCYFIFSKSMSKSLGWTRIYTSFLLILSGVAGIMIILQFQNDLTATIVGYVGGILVPVIWVFLSPQGSVWTTAGMLTLIIVGYLVAALGK